MNELEKDALGSVYNPITLSEIEKKVIPLLRIAYKENDVINKILNIEKFESLSLEYLMN